MGNLKVLNLYAGIGGNRKLWSDVKVTAVEMNKNIADIYKDFFPNDTVIIGDAHQYLLDHYKEFDFIWSSPPCPTHSRLVISNKNKTAYNLKYPDMSLYQEIIFLDNFFQGKWCVENVISYYKPLIIPYKAGFHYFWSNFKITDYNIGNRNHSNGTVMTLQDKKGLDISKYNIINKRQILRNCVEPELGLHVLNCLRQREVYDQHTLFNV